MHTWSLNVEEQFYFLWPAFLYFFGKIRGVQLSVILILASPLIRILFYLLFPAWRDRITFLLHTRLDALMGGCFLALVYDHPACKSFLSKFFSLKMHIPVFVFLFCATPFLVNGYGGKYLLTVGFTFESLATALLVCWATLQTDSFMGRILNSKVAVHIGVLSYGLYLWQQLFITETPWSFWSHFPQNLVAIFTAAHLSYYCIEKPFLRYRRKFAGMATV